MNIKHIKRKYEGIYVIDEDTGEIITFVEDQTTKPKHPPFDKDVGVDVKHPVDCVTKDSLLETLKVIDGYINTKVIVNSYYLVDSVIAKLITPQEVSLINYIANRVVGWNYYIGSLRDLTNSGVDSKHISGVIKKLFPNTLRVLHKDKPFRGDVVIQINPLIAWKGDNKYKSSRIVNWYDSLVPLLRDEADL